MIFRLADVKKTVRSRSDGERYVHPKLLSGPSITAQVGLALAYFNARLGRARHEFDAEVLVRFFGDAKVARGLVACLGETYRWRPRTFADVLTPAEFARLVSRGLPTPCDLRLYLYDTLNADSHGFLAAERDENLPLLARRLHLAAAKLDQLVALDADENAVLVRIGSVPEPEHVVALYNYHVVSALLRNSSTIDLTVVRPDARHAVEAACTDLGVAFVSQGEALRLLNQSDVFGNYARWGARLLRALLAASALAPDLLSQGTARVVLGGRVTHYLLSRDTAKALTAGTGTVRCAADVPGLREAWARGKAAQGTDGWRLLCAPEPVVCAAGLAVAPFVCQRQENRVLLWPLESPAQLEDARRLSAAGLDILPLLLGEMRDNPAGDLPCVVDPLPQQIAAALTRHWSGGRVEPAAQALAGLLDELDTRGFVPESDVVEALGCATPDDLAAQLRTVDSARATYIPGLGLCSSAFAQEMQKGLRRAARRKPAA